MSASVYAESGPEPEESLAARVRRVDPERWLAARFADAAGRERLDALYAFHYEIARVRETVSDPLIGEIRLAWWREAVEEIYAAAEGSGAPPRRHPIVAALAAALQRPEHRPPRALFDAVIDARLRDLSAEERFRDRADVAAYAEATAGGLIRLAARMLVAHLDARAEAAATDAAAAAAGRAWGLGGLARAFPVHAASGWITAPGAPSAAEIHRLVAAHDADAVARLVAPLVDDARAAHAETRDAMSGLAPQLWPAFGYLRLLPSRLDALARGGPDAFDARPPGLADRLRLFGAALRGRV